MSHRHDCNVTFAHSDGECSSLPATSIVGNSWQSQSDSNPNTYYTITVRADTVNGGTYLHCECPSWPRSVAKGGCKHVIRTRAARGEYPRSPQQPIAINLATKGGPSEADLIAARRLLGLPDGAAIGRWSRT